MEWSPSGTSIRALAILYFYSSFSLMILRSMCTVRCLNLLTIYKFLDTSRTASIAVKCRWSGLAGKQHKVIHNV